MREYVLTAKGEPMPAPDFKTWAIWLHEHPEERRVAEDHVGDIWISTVFLALDYGFGNRAPILWETMIFGGGDLNGWMDRCAGSREQAEAMHEKAVAMVRSLTAHSAPS
jgi:hypothetical protein